MDQNERACKSVNTGMVGNIGKILGKGVGKRNMELYIFSKFQENIKVWITNLIFGDELSRAGMTHFTGISGSISQVIYIY